MEGFNAFNSTPTPALNEALAKAKPEFETIVADELADFPTKNGGRMTFYYADLEDIHPRITNALSKNGLALSSQIRPYGQNMIFLVTTLRHTSGEQIDSWYPLTMPEAGRMPGEEQKSFGVGITYARRYNVLCLLELSVSSDEESKKKRQTKAAIAVRKEVFDDPTFQKPTVGNGNGRSANKTAPTTTTTPNTLAKKQAESVQQEDDDILDRYTRERSGTVTPVTVTPNQNPPMSANVEPQYLYPYHNKQLKKIREQFNISTELAKQVANGRVPGNLNPDAFYEMVKDIAIAHAVTTKKMGSKDTAKTSLTNALTHVYNDMPVLDGIASWLESLNEFPPVTQSTTPIDPF